MSRILRAAFLRRLRHQHEADAEACGDDASALLQSARSLAEAWIDNRWKGTMASEVGTDARTSSLRPMPQEWLAGNLKEFWHLIFLAAKHSKPDSPQQQAIVDLISAKKNDIGALERSVSLNGDYVIGTAISSDKTEIARTDDGVVWSDLPYFRSELLDEFLRAPPLTSTDQWTNLHACAARLTAASLRDLGFYAIWAMFDALEEVYGSQTSGQTICIIPPIDHLGPVLAWLQHAGPYMFRACQDGRTPPDQRGDDYDCQWDLDGPEFVGRMAQNAGIQRSGFSRERYALMNFERISLD